MTAAERRQEIRRILLERQDPISASELAAMLGVSRQIVVGDVALLRASGEEITAMARGYVMPQMGRLAFACQFVCAPCASVEEERQELYRITDNGGSLTEISVKDEECGVFSARVHLDSRYEVDRLIERAVAGKWGHLCEEVHTLTVNAPQESVLNRIKEVLQAAGRLQPQE